MRYAIHGIIVETPFPCPELPPAFGEADVTVKLGRIGPFPFHWRDEGVCYKAAPGKYLLSVPGIADYFVENGKEVTIAPAPQAEKDALRLFFYNEVMGALLMQRGNLLFKGFAAARDGKAFAFTGPTPSGKTMLAAKLARQGFHIFSDGFFCLTGNEKPQVQPGHLQLMLWEKSLTELGILHKELKPVRCGMRRFYLPLDQSFCDESTCLDAIFILAFRNIMAFRNQAQLLVEGMKGAEKLSVLLAHRYHPELAEPLGIAGKQNLLAANLVNSAKVRIIRHNDALEPFGEFVELMEKELEAT